MTDSEYDELSANIALRKCEEALRINETETTVIYFDDASESFPMSECLFVPTNCNYCLTN